jgi:hypothetical protein
VGVFKYFLLISQNLFCCNILLEKLLSDSDAIYFKSLNTFEIKVGAGASRYDAAPDGSDTTNNCVLLIDENLVRHARNEFLLTLYDQC